MANPLNPSTTTEAGQSTQRFTPCPATGGASDATTSGVESASPSSAGVTRRGFCCGLRVVSMDDASTDVPNAPENDEYFGRPSTGPVAPGGGVGHRGAGRGHAALPTPSANRPWPETCCRRSVRRCWCWPTGTFCAPLLVRDVLATGAHIRWRASTFRARYSPGPSHTTLVDATRPDSSSKWSQSLRGGKRGLCHAKPARRMLRRQWRTGDVGREIHGGGDAARGREAARACGVTCGSGGGA
jgi:hypothetical protein